MMVDWNKCLGCDIFLSLDHVYGVGSDLDIPYICNKCLDKSRYEKLKEIYKRLTK